MCTYDTTMHETMTLPTARSRATDQDEPRAGAWVLRTSREALVVVALLSVVFLFTSLNRLNHTDLWGHLAFGRWMVEHGSLVDGSAVAALTAVAETPSAARVVNVPWLAQVLGYLAYRFAGADCLVLGHALLATAACALVIAATTGRGVSIAWGTAAGLSAYVLSLPVVGTIRPQLFGMALFPLVLYALADLAHRSRSLVWLPFAFGLWANLHGSFAVGLVAIACWTVGAALETRREAGSWRLVLHDPRVKRLAAALALSTAACAFNPVGPRLLLDVGSFSSGANLSEISEWRPLVLESLGGALFFGSVLATFVVVRYSPLRLRAEEIVTLVVFAALALTAMRMLAWWALVWPFAIAPHAAACLGGHRARDVSPPRATTRRTWVALALLFATIIWSPATNSLLAARPRGVGVAASPSTPLHVALALEELDASGPLFAPMDWADFLVWHRAGRTQPLVFTHAHLFSASRWSDFRELARGGAAWLDVVDYYGLRYLVLDRERNRNLHLLALVSRRCRVVYQDEQAVLVEVVPESEAGSSDATAARDADHVAPEELTAAARWLDEAEKQHRAAVESAHVELSQRAALDARQTRDGAIAAGAEP